MFGVFVWLFGVRRLVWCLVFSFGVWFFCRLVFVLVFCHMMFGVLAWLFGVRRLVWCFCLVFGVWFGFLSFGVWFGVLSFDVRCFSFGYLVFGGGFGVWCFTFGDLVFGVVFCRLVKISNILNTRLLHINQAKVFTRVGALWAGVWGGQLRVACLMCS